MQEAEAQGLAPLRYDVFQNEPVGTLLGLLLGGTPAGVNIDYGTLSDEAPELSSDRRYRGANVVWLRDVRCGEGGIQETLVFDPLADGRRANVPKGPQWWPWSVVEAAVVIAAQEDGAWIGGAVGPPIASPGSSASVSFEARSSPRADLDCFDTGDVATVVR